MIFHRSEEREQKDGDSAARLLSDGFRVSIDSDLSVNRGSRSPNECLRYSLGISVDSWDSAGPSDVVTEAEPDDNRSLNLPTPETNSANELKPHRTGRSRFYGIFIQSVLPAVSLLRTSSEESNGHCFSRRIRISASWKKGRTKEPRKEQTKRTNRKKRGRTKIPESDIYSGMRGRGEERRKGFPRAVYSCVLRARFMCAQRRKAEMANPNSFAEVEVTQTPHRRDRSAGSVPQAAAKKRRDFSLRF